MLFCGLPVPPLSSPEGSKSMARSSKCSRIPLQTAPRWVAECVCISSSREPTVSELTGPASVGGLGQD